MALDDTWNITRPGQVGATGAINALHLEEYTGVLHGTVERRSRLTPWIPVRTVRGTSVISSKAIGESTLQVVVPGSAPDGTKNKVGKNTLTIDTLIAARSVFPLLETWQADYGVREATAMEHGKKIGKWKDQSFFIQALKAGLLTSTKYSGVDAASGHYGGSQQTLTSPADALDPAKLYAALTDLIVKMRQKDVDPREEDAIIGCGPEVFHILGQNEQLINTNYVTANGTKLDNVPVLKAYGIPLVDTNNFVGGQVITGHELSNAANSNAYDGDFSKVVAAIFSPQALLAGETIPLTPQMFWSDEYLHWVNGAYLSFGVTADQGQYAGVILKP